MKNYYGLLILLYLSYPSFGQVKFIIESLPETTPAQDSIFITGTFNSWNTSDPKYLLRKQPNGQLAVILNINEPVIEYKFTRGDWLKVETGAQNEYIPNRTLVKRSSLEPIPIRIKNWQDLGGARSFEYLIFYYFSIAFLSIILLILSFRIFKKDPIGRQVFVTLHGFLAVLYLSAVTYFVVNPIWQSYLTILGQALIFVWGPMAYFFIKHVENKENLPVTYSYFLPVILASLIALLRLMNFEFFSFFSVSIRGFLTWGKVLLMGGGAMFTLYFLVKIIVNLNWSKTKGRPFSFFLWVLILNCVCLCFVFLSLYADGYGLFSENLGEYKWFFVLLSLWVWTEVIVLWKDPQFFKEKSQVLHIDNADRLLLKLRELMEKEKVYHNAELSVNRLAELMETKPHILSKLLNEHFEQNFRDYVNGYRVEEFIDLANDGRLEKLTYLGLAHEVGFNSKSTFNLAFKKFTQKSPRDFFKSYAL
ncbi:MAG: helix-turn-helix domain-containing protein [Reichenbachiella sp.]|uniref:helix-turn-helix domain-containing protein n=1 Tax=Reichenbachiella sp. TaxID=2184521 RepID=UPI0029663D98|nr:helix-turn-helix domain-containing protein [Reichenbachiella sp.]MDW3208687.1 helix-turn-helix domain-containing protein [Reichenbachiella sp.]